MRVAARPAPSVSRPARSSTVSFRNTARSTTAKPSNHRNAQPSTQKRTATLLELRGRMKAVASLKKITGSMKMVAAAKLKMQQRNLEEMARPFCRPFEKAMEEIDASYQPPPNDQKHTVFVPVTSDRGLCGAINSSIVRETKKIARTYPTANYNMFIFGDKGKGGLYREFGNRVQGSAKEIAKKPPVNFGDIAPAVDRLLRLPFDELSIHYNKFVSAVQYNFIRKTLASRSYYMKADLPGYDFDDAREDVMGNLYEYYVATTLYYAINEHGTAELGARMSSMDNATKNAGEMLSKLTLNYNRTRQAKITTELCEIIGGAEVIKVQK